MFCLALPMPGISLAVFALPSSLLPEHEDDVCRNDQQDDTQEHCDHGGDVDYHVQGLVIGNAAVKVWQEAFVPKMGPEVGHDLRAGLGKVGQVKEDGAHDDRHHPEEYVECQQETEKR